MISRAFYTAVCLFAFANAAMADELQAGKAFPAFSVQEFAGNTFNLSALRGKVVLVHFWATWCPECREEMPVIESFYRQHHHKGLETIAISIDHKNRREKAAMLMRDYSYGAAMLLDVQPSGMEAPQVLPVTYVIDKNGVIQAILRPDIQPLTEETLQKMISPLLKR